MYRAIAKKRKSARRASPLCPFRTVFLTYVMLSHPTQRLQASPAANAIKILSPVSSATCAEHTLPVAPGRPAATSRFRVRLAAVSSVGRVTKHKRASRVGKHRDRLPSPARRCAFGDRIRTRFRGRSRFSDARGLCSAVSPPARDQPREASPSHTHPGDL
eukprot:360124-Chlamydomonas_euryale.AAC.8